MTNKPKATANKQIENDKVIVTEWRFAPGAETGWHRHHFNYIVVPGLDGKLLLETRISSTFKFKNQTKNYFNILLTIEIICTNFSPKYTRV